MVTVGHLLKRQTFKVLFDKSWDNAARVTEQVPNGPPTISKRDREETRGLLRTGRPQDLFTLHTESRLKRPELVEKNGTKFKSVLLEAPSGSGVSSAMLGHAFDSPEPSIYFVENERQFQYFTDLIKYLRPGTGKDRSKQDFAYIKNHKAEQSEAEVEVLCKKSNQPKIYFVTRKALQQNLEQLKTLVERTGVRNFYYDNVNTLKNENNNDEENDSATNPNLDNLCELMSASTQRPNLIGSINFAFHPELTDDIYVHTDHTLASVFPVIDNITRFRMNKERTSLGLPALEPGESTRFKVIDFPPIGAEASGLPTVAKILRNQVDNADTYINRIVERLRSLKGRTIIKTINNNGLAKDLKDRLEKKLGTDDSVTIDNALSSDKKLNWFFEEPFNRLEEQKFLITSNSFNQVHLPIGSYDNFVYLDAPTSSTALAQELSVASSDPNVDIHFIRPANSDDNHQYKFPGVDSYKPVQANFGQRSPGIKRAQVPRAHASIIEQSLNEVSIKDENVWLELLKKARTVLGINSPYEKNFGESMRIKNFVKLTQRDFDVDEKTIIAIIKGKTYNPEIFRRFIKFLFEGEGLPKKFRDWYLSHDETRSSTGMKELSFNEALKTFPTLMGVLNFEEAQLILSQFSLRYQYHLDFIDGFVDPDAFSTQQKLEILLNLLKYINIDKELLKEELNINESKLEIQLKEYLEGLQGELDPVGLHMLTKIFADYQLLAKLFPNLIINQDFPIKCGDLDYLLSMMISNKSIKLQCAQLQGETKHDN